MEIKTENLPTKIEKSEITNLLNKKVQETDNVKTAIDFMTTKTALEQEGTVEKLVTEKTEELKNDAEAKRVKAETDRTNEEVKKVLAEKEKEIAELEKIKSKLEGEVANLKSETNKANAYFEANKSILKCVGVREPLSLKAMQCLMIPSGTLFTMFQILLLPFTLIGFAIESLMNIVGAVCGKIAKNGWKIAMSIIVTAIILAMLGGIYFVCIHYAVGWFK